MECDYLYEARCQSRFKALVEADPEFDAIFTVPAVVPELSTERVLTTEYAAGVHIDNVSTVALSQSVMMACFLPSVKSGYQRMIFPADRG